MKRPSPSCRRGWRPGRYTSRQITELYLHRIDEIDRQGPTLRSVIRGQSGCAAPLRPLWTQSEAARGRAARCHGIPVLIKDNIDTSDRMMTTAGSLALEGSIAAQDAFVVAQLRAAGAVILGKTNLSEWANFRSAHSTSGWSGRGGQIKNPYALDRNPCGSSSGTGAAIAANLAAIGVGTETDGSIVCPSGANGLVGIKPTVGLVSRSGIIPISHSQDTAGPMARTVADAAMLLTRDRPESIRRIPRPGAARGESASDYVKSLDAGALQGSTNRRRAAAVFRLQRTRPTASIEEAIAA